MQRNAKKCSIPHCNIPEAHLIRVCQNGHDVCLNCIRELLVNGQELKCPICRDDSLQVVLDIFCSCKGDSQNTHYEQEETEEEENEGEEDTRVVGSSGVLQKLKINQKIFLCDCNEMKFGLFLDKN